MSTKESEKLLDFVTNLAGEHFLKVEKDIGSGYFILNVSEAERRQAKHDIRSVEDVVVELVRNSRDAGAGMIMIATGKDSSKLRRLTIIDDGNGVPASFHQKIFEPRVTSKINAVIEDRFGVHGRGMALYSIQSNVDEVELVGSEPGRGAIFKMAIDTNRLGERKDQSTQPKIKIVRNKVKVLAGPHNIYRHLVEFSIESDDLDIFFGTDAEVLATMISLTGKPDQKEKLPFWRDVVISEDPEVLNADALSKLGLRVSARNCQRIIAGQIRPLRSIKCQLSEKIKHKTPSKKANNSRTGAITEDDLEDFAQAIAEKFRNLGQKYFLKVDGSPRVSSTKKSIRIELTVSNEDSW